jgi:hypothetical protein
MTNIIIIKMGHECKSGTLRGIESVGELRGLREGTGR